MNKLLIMIILLFSVGCAQTPEEREIELESLKTEQGPSEIVIIKSGRTFVIYQFEKCYYIKFAGGETGWGGHYGLCPNPVHRFMHPDSINANINLPDTINISNLTPSLLKDSTVLYKLKPNSQ